MMDDQLLQDQLKPPNQQDFHLQAQLTEEHHRLLTKDEEFHHQRAKKNWALRGDRNIAYFHQAIIKRTRNNRITYLCNLDGTESTTQEHIASTLIAYFQDTFSSQAPSSLDLINHSVSHFHVYHQIMETPHTTKEATTPNVPPPNLPELEGYTNS
jgi:hypothetical protein